METKHTKEYAEKMAKEKYPDRSYWIGAGSTARIYDPDYSVRKEFIDGYMKAIEETNVSELLELLIKAREFCITRGINIESDFFIKMTNAIKKQQNNE